MDRKHQVFVSSTYKDLIEERKEVIHALLELDCIPAGMELFPATDSDAWALITSVIDDCDYYVLILAGKYGSTSKDGIGYTEMEFDYAVSTNKPIIAFLHQDIDELKGNKLEKTEAMRSKLDAFREKAQERHCKYWESASDLGGKISRSLVQLRKRNPSEGWIPGRYAADQKMLTELASLRLRVQELQNRLSATSAGPPDDSEALEGGADTYSISLELRNESGVKSVVLSPSWDRIFSYCGPELSGECTDEELIEKIRLVYYHEVPRELLDYNDYDRISLPYVCIDQIIVQLQALGLMEPGSKKRTVSDTRTYWRLTEYGAKYLIQIRALRKQDGDEIPF